MKKTVALLLTVVLFCSLLSISAAALSAPDTEGIYFTGAVDSHCTVTPCAADGSVITPSDAYDCNQDGTADSFYAAAQRFTVKYTASLTAGDQYAILMYTGSSVSISSILYINQITVSATDAANGYLTFDVYPTSVRSATIKITSDAESFSNPLTVAAMSLYTPYILGDTDGDKSISALDAVCILQYIVGSKTLTASQRLAADVDKDQSISAQDAVRILQHIVSAKPLG